MIIYRIPTLVGAVLLALCPVDLPAADIPDADDPAVAQESPLGARQRRIKRMVVDLERQFTELARGLQKEYPEQAERLVEAFKASKEMLLEKRMDDITEMLNLSKLHTAGEEQAKTIIDVKTLIELLLKEDEDDRVQKELEKLERWKEALDKLIDDEGVLKDESDLHSDKDKAMANLERQIEALEALIERQDALKDKTAAETEKGIDGLDAVAGEQEHLREETAALREEVEKGPAAESDQAGGDEAENADKPPSKRPGAQAMRDAEKDQKRTEKRLAEGRGERAEKAAAEALEDLGKALEELKKERDRIAEMEPEDMQGLAEKQEGTAGEAGELAKEMAESAEASPGGQGQQQDPLQAGQEMAREAVESAQGKMGKAAKSLAGGQPGGASGRQQEALDDLERARQEVQEQIDELKKDKQMDDLVKLEQIFREMLDKQVKISAAIRALATKRAGQDGKLRRVDRIELRTAEVAERDLAEKAEEAEGLLVGEGASVVVRNVVEGMKHDLLSVADLLDARGTGQFVQRSQKEIETTLEELIEALQLAQEMLGDQPPPPPQDGEPKPPPLLPPSAELKLLRLTQLRINRRTLDFDNEVKKGGQLDAIVQRQVGDAAVLQKKITESARELAARGQPPADAEID